MSSSTPNAKFSAAASTPYLGQFLIASLAIMIIWTQKVMLINLTSQAFTTVMSLSAPVVERMALALSPGLAPAQAESSTEGAWLGYFRSATDAPLFTNDNSVSVIASTAHLQDSWFIKSDRSIRSLSFGDMKAADLKRIRGIHKPREWPLFWTLPEGDEWGLVIRGEAKQYSGQRHRPVQFPLDYRAQRTMKKNVWHWRVTHFADVRHPKTAATNQRQVHGIPPAPFDVVGDRKNAVAAVDTPVASPMQEEVDNVAPTAPQNHLDDLPPPPDPGPFTAAAGPTSLADSEPPIRPMSASTLPPKPPMEQNSINNTTPPQSPLQSPQVEAIQNGSVPDLFLAPPALSEDQNFRGENAKVANQQHAKHPLNILNRPSPQSSMLLSPQPPQEVVPSATNAAEDIEEINRNKIRIEEIARKINSNLHRHNFIFRDYISIALIDIDHVLRQLIQDIRSALLNITDRNLFHLPLQYFRQVTALVIANVHLPLEDLEQVVALVTADEFRRRKVAGERPAELLRPARTNEVGGPPDPLGG